MPCQPVFALSPECCVLSEEATNPRSTALEASTLTVIPQMRLSFLDIYIIIYIPVNPSPFRGSLPRKSLISRMDWVSCAGDINLPHTPFPPVRYPPNKKIKNNKILTYILRSIFLEIPHLELSRWWITPRDTNVNDILLYDRLLLEINISTELKYKIPDVLIIIEQLMMQCIVTCFTT
jgi:hypothetical protein